MKCTSGNLARPRLDSPRYHGIHLRELGQGAAVPKTFKPDTSPDTLLDLYYCMLLSRAFEERLAILYRQGKVLGGIFSGIGQEATAVGTSFDLQEGDAVFPLHRDIGVALTRGIAPKTLMAQILGKSGGSPAARWTTFTAATRRWAFTARRA